jgi:hypothetical protein
MDVVAYASAARSKLSCCCHCGGDGIITALGRNDNTCVNLVRRQGTASVILYLRARLQRPRLSKQASTSCDSA